MKKITMMQLRKSPGLYIFWKVGHGGESFEVTNNGKSICQIIPIKKEKTCKSTSEPK